MHNRPNQFIGYAQPATRMDRRAYSSPKLAIRAAQRCTFVILAELTSMLAEAWTQNTARLNLGGEASSDHLNRRLALSGAGALHANPSRLLLAALSLRARLRGRL